MTIYKRVRVWSLPNLNYFVLVILCVDLALVKPVSLQTTTFVIRPSSAHIADKIRIKPFSKTSPCSNINGENNPLKTGECKCKWYGGVASTFISDLGECKAYSSIRKAWPFLYGRNLIPLDLSTSPNKAYPLSYFNGNTNIQKFRECFVVSNERYLNGGKWNPVETRYFHVVVDDPVNPSLLKQFYIKWNSDRSANYDYLQGKLVKLNITCQRKSNAYNGYMLLKIQGSYTYIVSSHSTSPPPSFVPVTPSMKAGENKERSHSEETTDVDSGVLVASIASAVIIISVVVIITLVCFFLRKKRSVPADTPEYLVTDSGNNTIQNNVLQLANLRNPTYQDFEQTPVYAEPIENYEQIAVVQKLGPSAVKNSNNIQAPNQGNLYQPLVKPEVPQCHLMKQPKNSACQGTVEDYSKLDKNRSNPETDDYDLLHRPLEKKKEKSHQGRDSDSMYNDLNGSNLPGNEIAYSPRYETLTLQATKTQHDNLKNQENEPDYGVLESPAYELEYGVLESPGLP